MKKTKKGYGKKALSVSLSMALMLGGTAPIQAADMFSDQAAEESTAEELYPADEESNAEENSTEDIVTEEDGADSSEDDFSAGQEEETVEFSSGDATETAEAESVETQSDSHVINTAADIPVDGIPAGETYELAADITLEAGQQISSIAGTLDGKGHVITLADKPLADQVSGTIQNLGVAGSSTLILSDGQGSVANTVTGTIQNCYSTASSQAASDYMDTIGGFVGSLQGTVANCYFAGNTDMFGGGIAATNGGAYKISHALWTAGMSTVGMGRTDNISEDSKKKMTADQIKANVDILNTDLPTTGFYWVLPSDGRNNGLPVLSEGTPAPAEVNWDGLKASIESAEKLTESDYTESSWKTVSDALAKAKEMLEAGTASQAEVNEAAKNLSDAISALKKQKPVTPVKIPEGVTVTHITSADQIGNIWDGTEGQYYVLDQDITLSENYMNFCEFNGVLDGQGHTVTLKDSQGLFSRVGESGVVQNIAFKGTIGNVWENTGVLGGSIKGAVLNCSVEISGSDACGFAKKLSGGVIANSIAFGESPSGALFAQYEDVNGAGLVKNCYWLDTLTMPSVPEGVLVNSMSREESEMKTLDLVELLNNGRGDSGSKWGQSSDGFPYFGENQSYKPDTEVWPELPGESKYQVEFTSFDGSEKETLTDSRIQVSPDQVNSYQIAGTFSLKDYQAPEGSSLEWNCTEMKPAGCMAMSLSDGELFVYKKGKAVITATQINSDGSSEIVAYASVIATTKKIDAVRLLIDGQDVTNGNYTVAGSETKKIQVQGRYEGEEEFSDMAFSSFRYKAADETLIKNEESYSSFTFVKPGTSSITVSSKAQPEISATVSLTSTYVPVESIVVGMSGQQVIHGRNANSDGQEEDGRVAFNPIPGSAVVTPENASFASDWTIKSSDDTIGYYSNGSKVFVPKQAGKVTYTAEIKDTDPETGKTRTITGSSEVEYVYKNPLTAVSSPVTEVTVKAGESQDIDLSFVGELSDQGYNVTDPSMKWTFDKKGVAVITKKTSGYWKREDGAPDTNSYFIGTDYRITGIGEGTVTATGTPVDQTNSPKPVTIKITVTKGDGQDTDNTKLASEGIEKAASYLADIHETKGYKYGDEWAVYALVRNGKTIAQDKLDAYYNSVCETVKTWSADQKPTDIERVALALTSMGKDITNVNGVNLAEMIYNSPKLKNGSNELIYALIALDAADIQIPSGSKWNRGAIIAELAKFQNSASGGIGLSDARGGSSDITAMALQALSVYRNQNTAAKKISDQALTYLKNTMGDDFGYGTSESTAQVLLALTSMGIDPLSGDFGTVNMNLITNLTGYIQSDNGFSHSMSMTKSSEMSTVQALQALDAYSRFVNKKTAYWDLKDKGEHTKHSWNTGVVTKQSTCKEKGSKTFTCTWCGEKKTESTALADHKWSSWKTTKEATVFAAKQITRTCSVCGKTEMKNSGSKLKATIKLSTYEIKLVSGKSTDKVKVSGLAKGDSVKSWKSSDTAIVKVDNKGVITAQKKTGTAYVTVTLASQTTAKVKVVVQKAAHVTHKWSSWKTTKAATVFAAKQITRTCSVCGKKETKSSGSKLKATIKLNAYEIRLNPGKSTNKVKVSGLAKGDSVKSWKSGNTAIVKVNNKGVITAQKKTGTAYITVTLASKKTAKVKVIVQKGTVRTTAITGLKSSITLKKGKTDTLKPVRKPITSAEKITYTSSNKKVVYVNAKGVIKGLKKGTAVITVKSGKAVYKCKVTVK